MSVLTRWAPYRDLHREMNRLHREMDRLFGRWGLESQDWPGLMAAYPAVNLREDDDSVYAEIELPGVKMQDLEITIAEENRLTLKGKREPIAPANAEWRRQERRFGSFERVVQLPVAVDTGQVAAHLENGVLTIQLAKSPAAKPRKIPVKAE